MGIESIFERVMSMSDDVWMRHASPWSVWTRIATFPLLMLALWSPHIIGAWSLIPIAILAAWIWLNPRLFDPPRRTDNWPAKVTFGERVWLNRKAIPIPGHHAMAAAITTGISAAGTVLLIAGALLAEPISFIAGGITAFLAKVWFCDRMVWLYEDMKDTNAEYASWLRR